MKYYIDSSVFLHLLLDGEHADLAEELLERVEYGESTGYVSALVVEEVSFKLAIAKASELGLVNYWQIKRKLLRDEAFRRECFSPVLKFIEYLNGMTGLSWVNVAQEDMFSAVRMAYKYGLLTADAIHAVVAMRLDVALATFDKDFKRIPGLTVVGPP